MASNPPAAALLSGRPDDRAGSVEALVSCAWTKVALEVADALGYAGELAPSDAEAAVLRDARQRIAWSSFLRFVGLIGRVAASRNALIQFGASMGTGRRGGGWMSAVVGPGFVYRRMLRPAWMRILPGSRFVVNREGGSGLVVCEAGVPDDAVTESSPETADAAEAFFWITAGQLSTVVMRLSGGTPARVVTTIADNRRAARFVVHLPESRTLIARAGRILRIVFASRNVARTLVGQHGELSQARLEKEELHAEFEELMENAPDGILIHDNGRILYANRAFARSLGVRDRDELIDGMIDTFLVVDGGGSFGAATSGAGDPDAGSGSGERTITLRGHRRSGDDSSGIDDAAFLDLACSKPIRFAGRSAQLVMVKDVTERHRLERQLMEAGDGERRRLAMDLHDGLGQLLSGMAFRAEALRRSLGGTDPAASELSRDLVALSRRAMQQARSLARGLDPVGRCEGGLALALENLARVTREIHGVDARVENRIGDRIPLAPEDEIQLYRIAQEATRNAARHAGASHIRLSLAPAGGGAVRLSIRDDGCGFVSRDGGDGAGRGGMGIKIMKFRAESIGARLVVETRPGLGTTVSCTFAPDEREPSPDPGGAVDCDRPLPTHDE